MSTNLTELDLSVKALDLEASPFLKLDADALRLVVDALDEDDALAFALGCRLFRDATCQASSKVARFRGGVRTRRRAAWVSVARLRWARGAPPAVWVGVCQLTR